MKTDCRQPAVCLERIRMKYSIIIPAYNEETRLSDTVHDYADFVQKHPETDQFEILLIVNGSRDKTDQIALELEKTYPFIRAWATEDRLGKGGAVLQGFDLAQGEIMAFSDADNSTVAEELKKLIDLVEQGAACAIGSRWLPDSEQIIRQPFIRRLASRVFNLIVRMLFQFSYRDTQCGAKAFRREAIQTIRPLVRSTGWAFDVELIWRLRQAGFDVIEAPIRWRDNSHSRIRMHRDAPSMLIELLKLRFRS
ncbi:MAG: glycosyltransferase family 2 protein [Candidatus Omnitrophota bacterium]|jgi:glycosyltransferase involved in cell wall biosynthesis|nr:MAG: glycosyltransferase family 2 protein [Candidatus Omnitrophota bacterium]